MGYHMYQETTPMCVGASGAIFGVCGAVAYLIIHKDYILSHPHAILPKLL